jgi:hypothetical protein
MRECKHIWQEIDRAISYCFKCESASYYGEIVREGEQ